MGTEEPTYLGPQVGKVGRVGTEWPPWEILAVTEGHQRQGSPLVLRTHAGSQSFLTSWRERSKRNASKVS